MKARRAASLGKWVGALALALGLALPGPAPRAQTPPPPSIKGTPVEDEALSLWRENKLIAARTKAEEALEADPDSIIGHFVLGRCYHEAEGILPKAMFHLGKARELFETRYGSQPHAGAPWRFHEELLFAIASLAGEMEEYDYQLAILDFHDALYEPDALAEHAWALLHLRRFDEARRYATRAIAARDPWQRSLGKNAMCAIESEARTREPQYKACLDALEDARRRAAADKEVSTDPTKGTATAVHHYNAALAALSVFKYDEVERLLRDGAKRIELTPANPWRLLVRLYTDGGRVGEAVQAAHEMQRWRVRQPASLRDQDRAESDLALATLLLVAGETPTAFRLVDRALQQPDRRGLTASTPEQALGASALLRRAVRLTHAEILAERASVSGTTKRLQDLARAAAERATARADEERVASVLSDDTRLESTFRVYLSGGIEPVPTWLLGDIIHVAGAGVVSVAIRRARAEEKDVPAIQPHLDAISAELNLVQRDYDVALRFARRALEHMPKAEALLAARVAAVGAEAARHLGNDAASVALYQRAMTTDPGTIRRLGLALPTIVRIAQDDPVLERAAELVHRSPRFREPESHTAFELVLDRVGPHARACLRGPDGTLVTCASAARIEQEPDEERAARLVHELHQLAFAMRIGLTQADLSSLDGSTTLAGQAQREQMQNILKDLADENQVR